MGRSGGGLTKIDKMPETIRPKHPSQLQMP